MMHTSSTVLAACVILWSRVSVAEIRHVPADHATIQACIDAAVNGDECVVAPGTYNETINFFGKSITLRSSHGPEVTTIDGTGLSGSIVTCKENENENTDIVGFTISGGTGIDYYGYKLGGGMYIFKASPSLSNCVFSTNSSDDGGGLYMFDSASRVSSCDFISNMGFDGGGGIACFSSHPFLRNCRFLNNSSMGTPGLGGAMYNNQSSPTIQSCTFGDNHAKSGGAMYNEYGVPIIRNCFFLRNTARSGGGLLNVWWTNPRISNSLFIGNSATWGSGGGLLAASHASPKITNCTLTQNFASHGGTDLAFLSDSPAMLLNCIIRGDAPSIVVETGYQHPTFVRSDIAGGVPLRGIDGGGNLDVDPLFVRVPYDGGNGWGDDPTTPNIDESANDDYGDLRLQPGSPCINAGDPDFVPASGESDLDGHARVLCGRVDMGPYEFGIGDYDCDQLITLQDFTAWQECMAGPGEIVACAAFDFNADSDVDLADFQQWQRFVLETGD